MSKPFNPIIEVNKRASYDYFIEQRWDAGLVLQGWEVKSLRAARVQLNEGHVLIKNNEAWLLGCHITPLKTVASHLQLNPQRSRKLLLTRRELSRLTGSMIRRGYTVIALKLYWKKNLAKLEIGLAKGKKEYDKRATLKEKEWQQTKLRLARRASS